MEILRRFTSTGFKVEFLQRLLNKAALRDRVSTVPLTVDGKFGPLTDAALRAFQSRHNLSVDGAAGPASWNALGLRTEREHFIQLFGQPTTTTCWSAAATMILGNQSVGPGNATLAAGGGMTPTVENYEVFARSLGWPLMNHSPGVQEMANIVQRTPVWIAGEGSHFKHAVVLSGVYSDGNAIGDGTMFRIHDPWPVGRGRIYGSFANPITLLDNNNRTRLPVNLQFVLVPR
jgi:hypothetical protein